MKDNGNQIENNKNVPKRLISALFTNELRNYFKWIGPGGSDWGLVNCNISEGAEIGCAFGGEKETGDNGFNGSDSKKQDTKGCSSVINYFEKTSILNCNWAMLLYKLIVQ